MILGLGCPACLAQVIVCSYVSDRIAPKTGEAEMDNKLLSDRSGTPWERNPGFTLGTKSGE